MTTAALLPAAAAVSAHQRAMIPSYTTGLATLATAADLTGFNTMQAAALKLASPPALAAQSKIRCVH